MKRNRHTITIESHDPKDMAKGVPAHESFKCDGFFTVILQGNKAHLVTAGAMSTGALYNGLSKLPRAVQTQIMRSMLSNLYFTVGDTDERAIEDDTEGAIIQ